MPSFSSSSSAKLQSCHPDLQELFYAVIEEYDCSVLEGHRSPERQQQLFDEGMTKTLNSNHLHDPSRAVDVMPYPINWDDALEHHKFATKVYQKAIQLGIKVRWGGNFKSFFDAPHWELL